MTDLIKHINEALARGDKSGGVQTRGGRDVVIYCTDAPGDYPIHGRIDGGVCEWDGLGNYFSSAPYPVDLIPKPRTFYVNVYESSSIADIYETREAAYAAALRADATRIACARIQEGQFDE